MFTLRGTFRNTRLERASANVFVCIWPYVFVPIDDDQIKKVLVVE